MKHVLIDELGNRYDRLVVQSRASTPEGQTGAYWLCLCDCGKEIIASGGTLRNGQTRSCGCRKLKAGGRSKTPEYIVWDKMIRRCHVQHDPRYSLYGGRGITVCDRWRESLDNFISDMGLKPGPEYSIDRVDNNLGYCPENCRWATRYEQARNRRNNRQFTIDGQTKIISDWAAEYKQPVERVYDRLSRGWGILDALTTRTLTPGETLESSKQ